MHNNAYIYTYIYMYTSKCKADKSWVQTGIPILRNPSGAALASLGVTLFQPVSPAVLTLFSRCSVTSAWCYPPSLVHQLRCHESIHMHVPIATRFTLHNSPESKASGVNHKKNHKAAVKHSLGELHSMILRMCWIRLWGVPGHSEALT